MKTLLSAAALALAIAGAPHAANAKTNVSIGIGFVAPAPVVVGYPPAYGFQPGYRGYTERDIEINLIRAGYRIEHIDRRGDAFFVRAFLGYDVFEGLIDCYGRPLSFARIGYYDGGHYWSRGSSIDVRWDRDGWYGRPDRDDWRYRDGRGHDDHWGHDGHDGHGGHDDHDGHDGHHDHGHDDHGGHDGHGDHDSGGNGDHWH